MSMKTYKTTGNFMLVDPYTRLVFDPNVPTPSEETAFVQERLAKGDLVVTKEAPAAEPEVAATEGAVPLPPEVEVASEEEEVAPASTPKKKAGK